MHAASCRRTTSRGPCASARHASWMFLAGEWACELKSPCGRSSTLARRHQACREELPGRAPRLRSSPRRRADFSGWRGRSSRSSVDRMPTERDKLRVLIVGGGIAALETVLALHDLAGERVAITLLAPNDEFVYRPMTVREPFAYARAARYPLASILGESGAEHVADKLDHVDPETQTVHTEGGASLEYDALVLALGAKLYPRFEHAITIDDGRMDEALHGLIQDVEERLPEERRVRRAWAHGMAAAAVRARPHDRRSGIRRGRRARCDDRDPRGRAAGGLRQGGQRWRRAAARRQRDPHDHLGVRGDTRSRRGRDQPRRPPAACRARRRAAGALRAGRRAACRSANTASSLSTGFCRVPGAGPVFAAGDAVDFPIKQGGVGSQQADVVAESIAALAGAEIEPHAFEPVIARRPADRRASLATSPQRSPAATGSPRTSARSRSTRCPAEDRREVPRSLSRAAGPARRRGMSARLRHEVPAERRWRTQDATARSAVLWSSGTTARRHRVAPRPGRPPSWLRTESSCSCTPAARFTLLPSPLSTPQERHALGGALFDELLLEGEAELLDTVVHTEVCDLDPVRALTDAAARYRSRRDRRRARAALACPPCDRDSDGRAAGAGDVPVTVMPAGDTGG